MARKKSVNVTEVEARTILAMANNGLSGTRAARELGYVRTAVYYQLRQVLEKTGKDPRDFYDMRDHLVPMARAILSESGGDS